MSEPFVGEIRMFAGNFAPRGWAFCDGQLLAVSQNDALFSLLGTIYGGDGRTTFGLPDCRGRIPLHAGSGPGLTPRALGSKGGAGKVTLTVNQLPSHTHPLQGSTDNGLDPNPGGNLLASSTVLQPYTETEAVDTDMAGSAVTMTG
ncbi:MAG TPA: tail fiber protein, partial [Longimicrobiales bacterium]|nr:tail fiber protein [Longimicrobiales bacterium]